MPEQARLAYVQLYRNTHGLTPLIARHDIAMFFGSVLVQLRFSGKHPELLLSADWVFAQVMLMVEVFCIHRHCHQFCSNNQCKTLHANRLPSRVLLAHSRWTSAPIQLAA